MISELLFQFIQQHQVVFICLAAGIPVVAAAVVLVLQIVTLRRTSEKRLAPIREHLKLLETGQQQIDATLKDEIARHREAFSSSAAQARSELSQAVRGASDALLKRMTENAGMQKDLLDSFSRQLMDMARLQETKLETMRITVDRQLQQLREDNSKKLEQMRITVDEKLHATLEQRLGASFRQVSDRLEQVYQGLGEMRHLAAGVGDLKKVLTNVKTRGTWGEFRLSSILEQILSPEQYEQNVATCSNSSDRVEFAVKLPGRGDHAQQVVWMPIDSKFPQEDYQRLIDAQEAGDSELAQKSVKSLEIRIKSEARLISEKYIDPPHTTDFGIMFLPVEGLYAEVLRRPGLCDALQREHRIVVTGPATLAALLNSLQMGFRSLAIEKRSSEVWQLLGIVKTEFGKFGDVLAKTKKKLQEASNTIDKAEMRTRVIERRLEKVQQVPAGKPHQSLEADERQN